MRMNWFYEFVLSSRKCEVNFKVRCSHFSTLDMLVMWKTISKINISKKRCLQFWWTCCCALRYCDCSFCTCLNLFLVYFFEHLPAMNGSLFFVLYEKRIWKSAMDSSGIWFRYKFFRKCILWNFLPLMIYSA